MEIFFSFSNILNTLWEENSDDFLKEHLFNNDFLVKPKRFIALKDSFFYVVVDDSESVFSLLSMKDKKIYLVAKSKTKEMYDEETGLKYYLIEDSKLDKKLKKSAVRPFTCTEIKSPQGKFVKLLTELL